MTLNELYAKVDELNKKHKICEIYVSHDLSAASCTFVVKRKDNEWFDEFFGEDLVTRAYCIPTGIKEHNKYKNSVVKKLEKILDYAESNIDHFDYFDFDSAMRR